MPRRRRQTIGYKYLVGMHAVLCQSSIDGVFQLNFADRNAWRGRAINRVVPVNRPSLFGGQDREGGVGGYFSVEGGEPTQGQNGYLADVLGGRVPNFRGVAALVFQRFYWGNNPYIKPWKAKVRNCYSTFGNFEKRYALLNPEVEYGNFQLCICLDNSTSMLANNKGLTALAAINVLLNQIPASILPTISLKFNRWSGVLNTTAEYAAPTSAQFDAFRATINATTFNGAGTNFNAAFDGIEAFFDASESQLRPEPGARQELPFRIPILSLLLDFFASLRGEAYTHDPPRRIVIFVTDGEPTPIESAAAALSTIAGMNVLTEFFAVQIDLADTQYTDPIDSTGEATVVTASNLNALSDFFAGIIATFADTNPAHILRDMLINPAVNGLGDESIIGDSFVTAAETFSNEDMGLSLFWQNPNDRDSFKKLIESHTDSRAYYDTTTGQWEIKLIRPDYDIGDLFTFDASNIVEWTSSPTTPKIFELTNQLTLVYTRRDSGKEASVTLTNIAGVQATGRIIPEKVEMRGITWPPLANVVAQRELQARSLPITRGAFRAAYVPVGLNVGSAIIVNEPRLQIFDMVCRIIELEEPDGKDNSVLIRFATDVFAIAPTEGSFAVVEEPIREDYTALVPNVTTVIEMPYYGLVQRVGETEIGDLLATDPDLGFWAGSSDSPGRNHISAQVLFEEAADEYVYIGNTPFTPVWQLTSELTALPTDTTFTAVSTGREVDIEIGDLLYIGDEIVRVDEIAGANGVTTFTVGRGCLDTVPAAHPAGVSYAVLWMEYLTGDDIQYTLGEAVTIKIAPQTRNDVVPSNLLDENIVYFNSRAFRPYPVGRLQLEGAYELDGGVTGTITATWVHRDRLAQTTAIVEDFTDDSVGPESGVSYSATKRLYDQIANMFARTDFFNDSNDFYVDLATYREFDYGLLSPPQTLTFDFDTDDVDFFDYSDVFAQSDFFLNAFIDSTVFASFTVTTSRESSPSYENWQTPEIFYKPLLPPIDFNGFYVAGDAPPLEPTVVALTTVGSGTWTVPAGVTNLDEVLIVAGGGGGGSRNRGVGGGGAGEVIHLRNVAVTPGQEISYTVGDGGAGGSDTVGQRGGAGGNSVFGANTAQGGGGGGGYDTAGTIEVGGDGGSGGGGGNTTTTGTTIAGGSSTASSAGFGNDGGLGVNGNTITKFGGGGGGAGKPGVNARTSTLDNTYTNHGGWGGVGKFFGTFRAYGQNGYFGGGGGGGYYNGLSGMGPGAGGWGGGGAAGGVEGNAFTDGAGVAGTDGTGGGGGGATSDSTPARAGGDGGSGGIYISYGATSEAVVTPTVISTATEALTGNTSAVATLPGTYENGDLLVVIVFSDNNAPVAATEPGWSRIVHDYHSTLLRWTIFTKTADGSDTLTITKPTSQYHSTVAMAIRDADVIEYSDRNVSAAGGSTNADPIALDLGSSTNALWLAVLGLDGVATISGFPSGYTTAANVAALDASSVTLGVAYRANEAASENPGAFTNTSRTWATLTLAAYKS